MGQGRVAEGTGKTAGNGDEGKRRKDAARGNDGRDGGIAGSRGVEVDGAYNGGEDGLDGVEEDGEVPDFRCIGRAIRLCSKLLLKIGPSEAIRNNEFSN